MDGNSTGLESADTSGDADYSGGPWDDAINFLEEAKEALAYTNRQEAHFAIDKIEKAIEAVCQIEKIFLEAAGEG